MQDACPESAQLGFELGGDGVGDEVAAAGAGGEGERFLDGGLLRGAWGGWHSVLRYRSL